MIALIDTHVHVACTDTSRFPRRPTGVGSEWWADSSGSAAAVMSDAASCGVERIVVVQAVGAYGYDSSCAASAVVASGGLAHFVPAFDMTAETPGAAFDTLEALAPVAGLRLFGVADGAPWLIDGRADAVWRLAAERGVPLVATIFTDRLDDLRAVVARTPGVPVVVDHCGFPDMAGDDGERALFALTDLAPVHLKVTTHVLAAWEAQGCAASMVDRLVAEFGADRLCWGSDHPQHQGLTYAQKLMLARRATANLDDAQRAMFFAGTAASLGWG